MPKSRMVLTNGEKDGLELPISASDVPQVFYAVPNLDDEKIIKTRGNAAKLELRDKLAVLAYKLDITNSTSEIFRMIRTPSLDKVTQI